MQMEYTLRKHIKNVNSRLNGWKIDEKFIERLWSSINKWHSQLIRMPLQRNEFRNRKLAHSFANLFISFFSLVALK